MFDIRVSVRENHLGRADLAALGITPDTVAALLGGGAGAWMSEAGGRALGFAIALADGTVFALFVRPEAEGRGIGRALLGAAEDWLFARHAAIHLTTGDDLGLRAHGFYRAMGWRPAGRERDEIRYRKRRAV